jgi:flotillin
VTPDPVVLVVVAAVVLVPFVLALLFKALYRVPSADQALIVTGAGAKRTAGTEGTTYKIVTAAGRSSCPSCRRRSTSP